jgi:hypothetical protein
MARRGREHRVAQSLHGSLYNLLIQQRHLAGWYEIGDSGYHTRLVHKEWPGTLESGHKRRPNFDLAVLTPAQLKTASIDGFAHGYPEPKIAIELGLNYDIKHLEGDLQKFQVAHLPHRYIVHFSRQASGNAAAVEAKLENEGRAKAVYVHLNQKTRQMRVRELKGSEFLDVAYERP